MFHLAFQTHRTFLDILFQTGMLQTFFDKYWYSIPWFEKIVYENMWELVLCNMCGANGTHLKCGEVKVADNYVCRDCGGEGPNLIGSIQPKYLSSP